MCTRSVLRPWQVLLLLAGWGGIFCRSEGVSVVGHEENLVKVARHEQVEGHELSVPVGGRKRWWPLTKKKKDGVKFQLDDNKLKGSEEKINIGGDGSEREGSRLALSLKRRKKRKRDAESKRLVRGQAESSLQEGNGMMKKEQKKVMKNKKKPAVHLDDHPNCRNKISSAKKRRWLRILQRSYKREVDVKTAYRMAVLSTLAYWDFHEKQMPENVSGFLLLSNSPEGLLGKQGAQKAYRKAVRGFRIKLCRMRQIMTGILRRLGSKHTLSKKCDSGRMSSYAQFSPSSCDRRVKRKEEQGRRYTFDYFLYNWYEPTAVPGVNYHDTDILVSTSGNDILVLAFAGSASVADTFTNAQTFEPAAHSGLFDGGVKAKNITMHGSIHRGFLNAYSRVERGSVLRLCHNCSSIVDQEFIPDVTRSLRRRYVNCIVEKTKKGKRKGGKRDAIDAQIKLDGSNEGNASSDYETSFVSDGNTEPNSDGRKATSCRVRDEKLMSLLRELVTDALAGGRKVHLTGHSLGGGLATLLALDIIVNFPQVPVSKLYVWTFGAPQVADDAFLRSAIEVAPRLRSFVEKGRKKKRFKRFVTLSDDCNVDLVTAVTEKALPSHKRNLRGHAARTLGGVRGNIIHFADPHYLLTPDQHNANAKIEDERSSPPKTKTRSTLLAHLTVNYLHGISRESRDHPLSTDLPNDVREWLGEDPIDERDVAY